MEEYRLSGSEVPSINEQGRFMEWSNDCSLEDLNSEVSPYFSTMEAIDSQEHPGELIDEREYGLKECVEAAKEIFTRDVLMEWKNMSYGERKEIAEKYSAAVATSLGIEPGRVIFHQMPERKRGFNTGDGNIHLNSDFLGNPKNVIDLIDTIAHETRHQFQFEAIKDPERFGISPDVLKEWQYGFKNYTQYGATQYDPWGYHYNPIEIDARYFGETVVREVTKELIGELNRGERLSGMRF